MYWNKVIKSGDIFVVKLEGYQRYFQHVADDMSMLNSTVIRVFKEKYPLDSVPDLVEVSKGEVDFYANTMLRVGIGMGFWEKAGKAPIFGEIDVIFRDSEDYGRNKVEISKRWYVWMINEEFRYVGKLKGKNRTAEIGIVEHPIYIYERMRTGVYYGFYPGFE
jgi:hypothetical protein